MNALILLSARKSSRILLLFFCVVVGGVLSVFYGPDANWDLQNYHLYNPFHFIHDRIKIDFMAAGVQTYLNPILDLPYYFISVDWFNSSPKLVAFIAGWPYGLVIFLCILISNEIALSLPSPSSLEIFLTAVFGLTGTIVLSEVGTTFNDIQIAAIVLLALLFELKAINREAYRGIAAGTLLGISAGFKLTASIFSPAMLFAILITSKDSRAAFRTGFKFCVFWCIGFSISGGFWAYELFNRFGNPVFPFVNSVFDSPWYMAVGLRDSKYMPKDIFQAIFFPFYWLSGKPVITELPMRDGRYAIAFISVLFYGLLYLVNRTKPKLLSNDLKLLLENVRVLLILTFLTVVYILWEIVFSIGRYAIPIEILTGLLFLVGYKLCIAQFGSKSSVRVIIRTTTALIFATVIFTSLPINWGRLRYSRDSSLLNYGERLPKNSTVFVYGKPLAFVIPYIDSPGSVYIGLVEGVGDLPAYSPPIKMIRSRLQESFPIFILTNVGDAQEGGLSKVSDLHFDPSRCTALRNNYQEGIRLCPVK